MQNYNEEKHYIRLELWSTFRTHHFYSPKGVKRTLRLIYIFFSILDWFWLTLLSLCILVHRFQVCNYFSSTLWCFHSMCHSGSKNSPGESYHINQHIGIIWSDKCVQENKNRWRKLIWIKVMQRWTIVTEIPAWHQLARQSSGIAQANQYPILRQHTNPGFVALSITYLKVNDVTVNTATPWAML